MGTSGKGYEIAFIPHTHFLFFWRIDTIYYEIIINQIGICISSEMITTYIISHNELIAIDGYWY